jgi:HEPN domain-containing protein
VTLPLDFVLSDFVDRSFRDIADEEYIAARIQYRCQLIFPCSWSAHQALEKYLKAILLYNRKKTNSIRHDIGTALQHVKDIADLQFSIPDEVEDFISYVNKQGTNRYFTSRFHFIEGFLLQLDSCVWHIRKYCMNYHYPECKFDFLVADNDYRKIIEDLSKVNPEKHATKFGLHHGLLERIISDTSGYWRTTYEGLVWKNFYYGKRRKKAVQRFRFTVGAGSPTHYNLEDVYDTLKEYVYFEKKVRDDFSAGND